MNSLEMRMMMNELYEKALKANVARTEIAGDVNTKWTPDAIKIIKEKKRTNWFVLLRKFFKMRR